MTKEIGITIFVVPIFFRLFSLNVEGRNGGYLLFQYIKKTAQKHALCGRVE